MAMFSRRCLQRLLVENAEFLSPEQTEQHARLLNTPRTDYLSTEWEIAILHSLRKLGTVQHEPRSLGGSRFLDVVFESPAISFGADVAVVSDEQLHKRNPVDRLWLGLGIHARKLQIRTGGFEIRVGHSQHALGRGVRHDLLIPPDGKLNELVFNADFLRFMIRVAGDCSKKRIYCVKNSISDITIGYDPDRQTWGGTHLAYTGANLLDDNPVFHTLRSKARQLKKSGYSGLRGVILCDGGCQMLVRDGSTPDEYSVRQVINDLMRQNTSVGFVATIGLRHHNSTRNERGRYKPVLSLFVSRAYAAQKASLASVLTQMVNGLPVFQTSAANALTRVLSGAWRVGSFFGGYQMDGKRITLSAVGLLQLLAGNVSFADFVKAHGFDERNVFAQAAQAGRVFRGCRIESGEEEDDDWVTFELGEADPALAPFKPKRANTHENG